MNTSDILQTLHGLAAEDRAWIIERLPARAKARLLHQKEPEPEPEPPRAEEELPSDIDADRLAAVLADEPAWLAAGVRGGTGLTARARQTLIRLVLARVGHSEVPPARSRFQTLLARLGASRSRKRMTIHL